VAAERPVRVRSRCSTRKSAGKNRGFYRQKCENH